MKQKSKSKKLYDKVTDNIFYAWKDVRRHPHKNTPGTDKETINSFSKNVLKNIGSIREDLRKSLFYFRELRPVIVNSAGKDREILVYNIRERIAARAILKVIEPKFKKYYSGADYSISSRAKKEEFAGVALAAKKIQDKIREGYVWVVETDIIKFFDNIKKEEILKIIKKEIKDQKLFILIKQIIKFQVSQDFSSIDSSKYSTENGIAQGSSISPLLASIYLYKFDKRIQACKDVELVRYVDDFVILCKTEERAKEMLELSKNELISIGLKIHELNVIQKTGGRAKTKITKATNENFIFLGLNFNYLDIDISKDKKFQSIQDIREIIETKGLSLFGKRQEIFKKLEGIMRQYDYKHFTHYKTRDSLIFLSINADNMLKKYYIESTKKIFGQNIFERVRPDEAKFKRYYDFLGINFKERLIKRLDQS